MQPRSVQASCEHCCASSLGIGLSYSRTLLQGVATSQVRTSGVRAGEGASSSSFWLRRWMLQSRSNRCTTLPCLSASTCTIRLHTVLRTKRSTQRIVNMNAAMHERWLCLDVLCTTVRCAHPAHLELDVPGVLHIALQVHGAVAEGGLRLL